MNIITRIAVYLILFIIGVTGTTVCITLNNNEVFRLMGFIFGFCYGVVIIPLSDRITKFLLDEK